MPLSEQRLAQIRELSNDEWVDPDAGLDDAEFERLGDEWEQKTLSFCRENRNAEELHAFASTWNWDKGTWALQEILDNPACEAATALLIYWRSGPEFLRQYADRDAIAADPHALANLLDDFDFQKKIEDRYVAREFPVGSLSYDPSGPPDQLVGIYDGHREKFVRELPDIMYAPVKPGAPE